MFRFVLKDDSYFATKFGNQLEFWRRCLKNERLHQIIVAFCTMMGPDNQYSRSKFENLLKFWMRWLKYEDSSIIQVNMTMSDIIQCLFIKSVDFNQIVFDKLTIQIMDFE